MKAANPNIIKPINRKKVVGIFFSLKHCYEAILTNLTEKTRKRPDCSDLFSHQNVRKLIPHAINRLIVSKPWLIIAAISSRPRRIKLPIINPRIIEQIIMVIQIK